MLGFDTIGNATLIAYDGKPILATDPWINGESYFGSWGLSHAIPSDQASAIRQSKFIWLSHAHPDHINLSSLNDLASAELLLANHEGQRVFNDLKHLGFRVRILPEREWVELSPRVKVFTMSDENQDSILLVEIGNRLIVNLNDASPILGEHVVRPIVRRYKHSYLLKLWAYDADMINFHDENGNRIPQKNRRPGDLAAWVQADSIRFETKFTIPFSSFHRYQRTDSAWANALATSTDEYQIGVDPAKPPILPAFLRVDCETGSHTELRPQPTERNLHAPEEFGDHWADPLDSDEKKSLAAYFERKEAVKDYFGFLRFRVGGQETVLDLNPKLRDVGISFEAPRNSLITSIRYNVFDDMLIGNFMKTTLHGPASLYPHFTPYVTKYADNGGAETKEQLRAYFRHYKARDPLGHAMTSLCAKSDQLIRSFVSTDSQAFLVANQMISKLRGL